jgi:hypothetical protein
MYLLYLYRRYVARVYVVVYPDIRRSSRDSFSGQEGKFEISIDEDITMKTICIKMSQAVGGVSMHGLGIAIPMLYAGRSQPLLSDRAVINSDKYWSQTAM